MSGTLTLSGTGVWVFKSAGTLITSGTANVVGGDQCNVWWRVGSSATLGTNTSLVGNILALTTIILQTGADLHGRALAQTASVTLDNALVSFNGCAPPAGSTNTPIPNGGTPGTPPVPSSATQTAVAATLIAFNGAPTLQPVQPTPGRPAEVPESDTLLLLGGGLGGLATWLGWQWRQVRTQRKQ